MTNNDVLRRMRYILNYNDAMMIKVFGQAELEVTRAQVTGWLKREEDADFIKLQDRQLAAFLNGLINQLRGKKDGPQPVPEKLLTNNIILRKIKIALDIQSDEMLEIIGSAGVSLSKHELSAFFRKVDHKHYRDCQDQVLRNFLQGLQAKLRSESIEQATAEPS